LLDRVLACPPGTARAKLGEQTLGNQERHGPEV
jgi:hypothetical protein